MTFWSWYAAPIGMAFVIAAVAGYTSVREPLTSPGRYWAWAAAVFVLTATLGMNPSFTDLSRSFFAGRHVNAHLQSYDGIVNYLHRVEPSGTTIAIAEPGTFGFKLGSRYQVYDVLGLASPGVASALLAGDRNYVVRTWRPKYVVSAWMGPYDPNTQPGFDAAYELLGQFRNPYWEATVKRGAYLYRRKPGV